MPTNGCALTACSFSWCRSSYFSYEKHRNWIGQHFYDIRVVRVTKADYPAFKQVVLFGKKRKERHETGTVRSPPYPYIEDAEASTYAVPLTDGPSVFQGTDTITDEEVAGHWPNVVREIESICTTGAIRQRS